MFSRVTLVALLAFPIFASANPIRRGGTSCSSGPVQCCNSYQNSQNLDEHALGVLSVLDVAVEKITGLVGLNCLPVGAVGAAGTQCSTQTVCCQNARFNGLAAIGCMPININL